MNNYDFIIIGAGCSGLSLLYEMNKSNILKNKTCAIFDKRKQFTKDKIWSYWNVFDHSFSDCLLDQWDKVIVKGNEEIVLDCKDFTYQSVNSEKFYDKILKNVANNKNIKFFLDHSVDEISEEDGQITIKCKNEIFKANLVFDSSLKNNIELTSIWELSVSIEFKINSSNKIIDKKIIYNNNYNKMYPTEFNHEKLERKRNIDKYSYSYNNSEYLLFNSIDKIALKYLKNMSFRSYNDDKKNIIQKIIEKNKKNNKNSKNVNKNEQNEKNQKRLKYENLK